MLLLSIHLMSHLHMRYDIYSTSWERKKTGHQGGNLCADSLFSYKLPLHETVPEWGRPFSRCSSLAGFQSPDNRETNER